MQQARPITSEVARPGRWRQLVAAPSHVAAPPPTSCRQLALQLFSAAAVLLAQRSDLAAAAADLTPYQRGKALEYGLMPEGRLRRCPTDANPNCLSTLSTNETYLPPWEAPPGSSPVTAIEDIGLALAQVAPEAQIVDATSTPSSEYRRWAVRDLLFDHDDIEVLVTQRGQPESGEPPLVTIRSMAAQVKYIWPITQPITDFGSQRNRLKAVRQALGWRLLGCDLLECYEE